MNAASSLLPPALLQKARDARAGLRSMRKVTEGWRTFGATGLTPPEAYGAMRNLFCLTNGRFNDVCAQAISRLHPPTFAGPSTGVLGTLDASTLGRVLGNLHDNGFHAFDARLPPEDVAALRAFALEEPCLPTISTAGGGPGRGAPVRYATARDTSVRFDFEPSQVLSIPRVQALVADLSILTVAAQYLGCEPILDLVAMWWSRPPREGMELRSEAAQLFHFDMDRLRFLKFFFYLTDVDTQGGPHCFVRGSHRRNPRAARRDGRYGDAEVADIFGPDRVVELGGPAGSILAVDTRGFHKGKALVRGERLLLQLEFSVSRFGQNYPRFSVANPQPPLVALAEAHPRVVEHLDLGHAPRG